MRWFKSRVHQVLIPTPFSCPCARKILCTIGVRTQQYNSMITYGCLHGPATQITTTDHALLLYLLLHVETNSMITHGCLHGRYRVEQAKQSLTTEPNGIYGKVHRFGVRMSMGIMQVSGQREGPGRFLRVVAGLRCKVSACRANVAQSSSNRPTLGRHIFGGSSSP